MSYDIYGNPLSPGHCEVHPCVAQSYPCQQCRDEEYQDERYEDYVHEQRLLAAEEMQGMYGDGI